MRTGRSRMEGAASDGVAAPELADLRAFCLVVDLGSITAASKVLGETKGSVSRRLTRLEASLGVALLHRTPRRVQATEDGAAYRAHVGRALELLDDATAQTRDTQGRPAGRLRVTAPIDLGQRLLAPLAAEFVQRYPEVTVEAVLTDAVLDFDTHQIDVAVRAGGALRDSTLIAHRIEDVQGKLFAAPDYLQRRGTPREPAALREHALVLNLATDSAAPLVLRRDGDDAAVELTVRPSIVARDYSFAKEVAVAGGGIALLPAIITRREVEVGWLAPVLEGYTAFRGTLYLLHQGARFLQPKVRAFRDFVLGSCRMHGRPPARR